MSTEKNTDHVYMQGPAFFCAHCGQRYVMNLPCPIDVVVAACQAYVDLHADCPAPEKTA